MKKVLILLIATILIFSLVLSSCQKKESIKIGYAGTLSGLNADLSVFGRNGALMAVEMVNEAGGINGRRLELIVKDDKNDKNVALQVDKEFYKEGVTAIIGHMTSGMAELTVPFINENKILMISPTISADSLSSKDDYFFRMIPSNKQQAIGISEAMLQKNLRKAAIIYDNSNQSFAEALKNTFKEDYVMQGGEMVLEKSFNPITVDYKDISNDLIESGADGVFIIAAADNAVMICQNFYKRGVKMNVFLPSWAMTNDLLSHGGKSVEDAILVNFYDNESKKLEYKAFEADFLSKYGTKPSFSAQFSYEAVMVLAEVMSNSDELNSESLKQEIINSKVFNGLQGILFFDETGDISRTKYLYKVRDGKFILLKKGDSI